MRTYLPVVTAGGEVPRALKARYPLAAKALIPVRGKTLVESAVEAQLGCAQTPPPIAVVGPPEVKPALARFGGDAAWVQCGETLLDNSLRGLKFHGGAGMLLMLSPDLSEVTAEALTRFLEAVPPEAEIAVPVITKEQFLRRYPGAPNRFLRTSEGEMTMGSVFAVTAEALRKNVPLGNDAYRARKYPWRLGYIAGVRITWQLLTGRLNLDDVERRITQLCDAEARIVRVDAPELAYDIDLPENIDYLEAAR